ASGSWFPIGTTTVGCSFTDAAGNEGTGSFTVTVADTTAPVITIPTNIVIEATGPDGAIVTYDEVVGLDAVDGAVSAVCDPPSGSRFPIGVTGVVCTVTDGTGSESAMTFTVTVTGEGTTPPSTPPTSDPMPPTNPT